jgi:hypothetical protein
MLAKSWPVIAMQTIEPLGGVVLIPNGHIPWFPFGFFWNLCYGAVYNPVWHAARFAP